MHSKTNRTNHDFQIVHFLVGSCHTADGAYALLCDLHEDRDNAIKSYEASKLREQAKIIRAKRMMQSTDEAEALEGQADLVEIEAMKATVERNLAAAIAERATIEMCVKRINHLRQFKHLPDAEAHEAAQHDEWKFELIRRAENYILTGGSIPADHFDTMRMHPSFATVLLPAIKEIETKIKTGNVESILLDREKPEFHLEMKDLLALEAPKN